MNQQTPVPAFSPEDLKRRKKRAMVLALILVGLVVLFYITTIVRLGASLAERVI
jgi:accessory gene regulator protein AgrB